MTESIDPVPNWMRDEAEQDWADRWLDAWDRLERIGVVGPDDRGMTLTELESLTALLGSSDD